jgi:predicted anti-sigma-YlaC factor YlaD
MRHTILYERKMNPCSRYEESLILYSHQELGRKKVVTLQKHLSQCERCRTYLDELNRVFQIIENQPGSSSDLFLDIPW